MVNDKKIASLAGEVSLGGDLPVHRLGFGAMRLTGAGIWGPPKDRKQAMAVLRRAIELGVNFIDTADSYGPAVSEELIAEALFPYPPALVVATKLSAKHVLAYAMGLERGECGHWKADN